MRILHRMFGLILVASCTIGLSACSTEPNRLTGATLEGTVTYGNEKVPVALVIVANDKGSAQGFIGDDGRYRIEHAPLGEVSVAVNTEAGKGELRGRMMAQTQGGKTGRVTMPKVVDVPQKYFDPTQSGIKTTIKQGANTFDIVLPK